MALVRAALLGRISFEIDAGEIARPGSKATAIFAFLSARPDGRARRSELADLLWEDVHPAAARHALRQCILRLRAEFGEAASAIGSDRQSIWLDPARVDVDVRRFEEAVRSGDRMAAAALWRGRFCEGLDVGAEPFEVWLRERRAGLDLAAMDALACAAAEHRAACRTKAAVLAARARVALDPFDECAQAALIETCVWFGRVGEARAAFEDCVTLFRRELDAVPGPDVSAALVPVPPVRPVARPSIEATTPPLAPAERPLPIKARRGPAARWAAAALLLLFVQQAAPPAVPVDAAPVEWVSLQDVRSSRNGDDASQAHAPEWRGSGTRGETNDRNTRLGFEAVTMRRIPVGC